MKLKKKLGIPGAYLLGALALGTNAYAQKIPQNTRPDSSRTAIPLQPIWYFSSHCPTNTPCEPGANYDSSRTNLRSLPATDAQRQRTFINQNGEWTTAGDGIFAKSFVNDVPLYPGGYFPLAQFFDSREPMQFSFIDAKRGLERIARNIPTNTGRERAFRNYLQNLARETEPNDENSLRALNSAVEDGIIDYNEIRGNIREGTYLAMVRTRTESVPVLLNLSFGYNEERENLPITQADTAIPRAPRARIPPHGFRADHELEPANITREEPRNGVGKERGQRRGHKVLSQERQRRALELGIETGYGIGNQELTIGGFANARIIPGIRLEAYGNWSALREDPYLTDSSTNTTQRERVLVGPGTYKLRTDEITTSNHERGVWEYGGRVLIGPTNWLDFVFGAGAKKLDGIQNTDGRSTISFLRNDVPLGNPEVISNSLENRTSPTRLSLEAGARANIGRNLGIGASYNRIGRQNNGKVNFIVRF